MHELELQKQDTIEERLDAIKRKKYYCSKCNKYHYTDSEIGRKHAKIGKKNIKLKRSSMKKEYSVLKKKVKSLKKNLNTLRSKKDEKSRKNYSMLLKYQNRLRDKMNNIKGKLLFKKEYDFKRASEMSYDECMKVRKKKIKANHPMLSDKEIEKYAKDRCLILSRKK